MSASRADSPAARAVAPLIGSLWTLFVIWSAVVALVWTTGFGEVQLAARVPNADLRRAVSWLLHALDAIWITLAAINVYLALVRMEGLETARRWGLMVLSISTVMVAVSSTYGWPLGAVFYPGNLGVKLGPLAFALPLLWLTIIVGARDLAQAALPRASHGATALVAGGIALLTDVNIEPLAWKWRAWWLWYPANYSAPATPPLQNYATWFIAGAALAHAMRSSHVVPRLRRRPFQPIAALAMLNAVCLLTHGVLFLRR